MKITVTAAEPKDSTLEAKLSIAAADVDAAVKRAYRDIANKYRFQGFRKGKAPRPVIDGLVGRKAVLAQASDELLGEATPLMLDELDVVPVGQPSFGDEPPLAEEGSDYTLSATITLRPDCELESYDAPEIALPPEEATDAEVDEQIDTLLGYHASFEDADDAYKAAEGDMLTLDIEDIEGGEELAGEDRPFMIGSSTVPAEFNDAIRGLGLGERSEIELERGDKKVKVAATLKAARRRVVPELTDELAKKSFGYDTVAELRDAVREEVAEDKKAQLPTLKETRVIEKLAEALKLDELPEAYVRQVFDEIAQDFLSQLQRQGLTLDQWLEARRIQAQDFIADLNAQAAERARQSLALDAIAKKLGLTASDDDVRAEFEKSGVEDVEASMKSFKDAGRMPAVRESVKRSKAVQWLVENARVREVDEVAERRAARAAAKDGAADEKPAKKKAAKPKAKKDESGADATQEKDAKPEAAAEAPADTAAEADAKNDAE